MLIKLLIGLLVCIPVEKLAEVVIARIVTDMHLNQYIRLLFYIMLVYGYITILFRKSIYKYAHRYVFVIIILMGIVQVVGTPPVVGISWDDEIHYERTAYISWGANGKIAPADLEIVNYYKSVIFERKEYLLEGREVWEQYINQYHEEDAPLIQKDFTFTKECVAYIPSAVGLAIGHLFDMPFVHTFMLGKFLNLLCYAFIICLSIKLVDRGKFLIAIIGTLPTSVFLAASYSYDWWITCLVILSYALFIHEIQLEKKITVKKMMLILSIMILALLPKAVYFPLAFPMMLWSNERYENPKICRCLVIGAMVILLSSFLIPMLIVGAGTGDIRGGSDVNAIGQIKYILQNPGSYISVLVRFLFDYLSPDNMSNYSTFYAYMGKGSFTTIGLPLIASACILDNNVYKIGKKENIWVRTGAFLGVAGSIVLVVTALYVSFTAVGHYTVEGCQPRYLLPVLFPGLYFLTSMNIEISKEIKENTFILCVLSLAFVFFYNMFEMCLAKY